MPTPLNSGSHARLTPDDVQHLCGEILDWKLEAIIDTGGDVADLQNAVAWLDGAPEGLGGKAQPLAGPAVRIYELLRADEDYPEDY